MDDKYPTVSQHAVSGSAILTRQTGVRRIFSRTQIALFALTYMSSWETIVSNLTSVLYNGGPETLAWGCLIAIVGGLAQSASLAEMASILPIAGAQYHWTAHLARTRHARFITWLQGWMTWFAWISLLAGVANFTAYIIQGIVAMNYETYVPQRWHLTLIIIAMLLIQALMNMYTFRLIPWIEALAGILHVVLFFIFVGVLWGTTHTRQSADFVFLETTAYSGWDNRYISWNLGLLTPVWGFVGFDGAIHMSEEVKNSRQAVPRAIFWTIALNGVMAYAITLTILFCVGSMDDVLNSAYPIFTVLQTSTGSLSVATAMTCGLLLISLSATLGSIASVSRLTWAWARDGGLPQYFSFIDRRFRVPVRAMWLPVFITMLLSLLNIASTAAFGAFLALSTMALYTSYFIAIACMLYARLSAQGVQLGEWNLGRWGPGINAFALVYTVYIFIFLPWPNYLPVTNVNMNYASPLWAFAAVFAVVTWWMWGRKRWPGLNSRVIEIVLAKTETDASDSETQ